MQLTNEFRVDASPATAWSVLTDLERIAPCMPGAQLQEVAGEEHHGIVKVKVGPRGGEAGGAASHAAGRRLDGAPVPAPPPKKS